MINILVIFCSAFTIVCLLGLQSNFVRDKNKTMSFIFSGLIGLCEILILKSVPNAGLYEMIAFVLGGPCGIVTSIVLHNQFLKLTRKDKDGKND